MPSGGSPEPRSSDRAACDGTRADSQRRDEYSPGHGKSAEAPRQSGFRVRVSRHRRFDGNRYFGTPNASRLIACAAAEPEIDDTGTSYYERQDGRRFLPPDHLTKGFNADRDIHTSAGAGLRFFLRSVAVPLVGVDAGYALPGGPVRILLVIGA